MTSDSPGNHEGLATPLVQTERQESHKSNYMLCND